MRDLAVAAAEDSKYAAEGRGGCCLASPMAVRAVGDVVIVSDAAAVAVAAADAVETGVAAVDAVLAAVVKDSVCAVRGDHGSAVLVMADCRAASGYARARASIQSLLLGTFPAADRTSADAGAAVEALAVVD